MKTCAIVAASDFNKERFCELAAAGAFDGIIAVDGGYAQVQDAGFTADIAIGDFDSLGYIPQGVETEQFDPHKDESDMELALRWACEHGFERVYIFGALGRRLDHTMANLQLFARFSETGMYIYVEDAETELQFLTGPAQLDIPARPAGTVSVFSMSDLSTGVCESGMEWDLDRIELTNRTSLGLSNEFTGQPVKISVETGTLVVFLPLP